MANISWTKEEIELLKINYPVKSLEDVAKIIDHSEAAIKTRAGKLGIKKVLKFHHKRWNIDDIKYIEDNYIKMTALEMGTHLGKTKSQIKNKIWKLGLRLPDHITAERLSRSFYPKGHVPQNKGKKWDEFMSKSGQENSRSKTFKKGNEPHNTLSDGFISIRNDKTGRRYKYIRLEKAKWKMLHVYNWEKVNGKVPKGSIIVFVGDSMNCEVDNLRMITRVQHMEESYNKDATIAKIMSAIPGKSGLYDKRLKEEILKYPELIELKRTQLKLSKQIRQREQNR